MYCVYKHTSPNGRVYIGITSQAPETRWQRGNGYRNNSYFTRAINKYGWDSFKHEILYRDLSEEKAKEIEIQLISEYKSNQRKYGYNISSGGESKKGTKISDWQKERIRQGNINKVVSDSTRKKLSIASKRTWQNKDFIDHMRKINTGKNNPVYGKHMTDEEKLKRKAKRIIQLNMNNVEIARFISIRAASEKTGVYRSGITACCRGLFKQAGGYIWKYAE